VYECTLYHKYLEVISFGSSNGSVHTLRPSVFTDHSLCSVFSAMYGLYEVIFELRYYFVGTVMFQLRRRTEHQSSSLRKSGSVDDVKVPRILPAAVQSPGNQQSLLYISMLIQHLLCRDLSKSVVRMIDSRCMYTFIVG